MSFGPNQPRPRLCHACGAALPLKELSKCPVCGAELLKAQDLGTAVVEGMQDVLGGIAGPHVRDRKK